MKSEPKIQAIILNHNDFHLTRECLGRLQAYTHRNLDILVIDNASTDGSADSIRAAFPGITVVDSGKNLGYAAGGNRGIELCRSRNPDFFFFLNNDAQVEPETLALLVSAAEGNPAAGIFGPLILTAHPEPLIESGGMKFNLETGRFRHLDFGRPLARAGSGRLSLAATSIDAISGCALLVRRKVIEKIGGFAEEYFFYFEDADFCLRARESGFTSLLVPRARVRHQGSSTINRVDPGLRVYFSTRNQLLFFNRRSPLPPSCSRSRRDLFIIFLNLAYALLRSGLPRGQALGMWRSGIRDFRRGRLGPAPERGV